MMKREYPKSCLLTIIVRTYNSARYLISALKSIIVQKVDWKEIETVVVDDGSQDKTKSLIRTFKKNHPFLNLRLLETPHEGPIKALTTGINTARGKFYILLDADDEFMPGNTLSLMVAIFEEEKETGFVYGDYYERDIQTNTRSYVSTKDNIFYTVAGGIMFRTAIVKEAGLYDESLFFPEYDLLIKLQKKCRGVHFPKAVFIYNRHKGSITSNAERVAFGKKQLFEKYGEIPQLRDY